ncbi:MAG: hypothetical protein CVU38_05800 [Chloroflexi bacterium HGW-Chloroflexi-1]|nr:MAG: hypothetical protein CVU38_05800 [Chloroflexi bacterium HGW-Chloroflexi-1]
MKYSTERQGVKLQMLHRIRSDAVAGLLTEPRWLGQETGHSERFPELLRRYLQMLHRIRSYSRSRLMRL